MVTLCDVWVTSLCLAFSDADIEYDFVLTTSAQSIIEGQL